GRAADDSRLGGVVEARVELSDVSPEAVPGRPENVADAVLEREVRPHLPAILSEELPRGRAPGRVGAPADLGVVREEAEGRVGEREAGRVRPVVTEFETAVLVVRGARNRLDVDLVEVVLARTLDVDAELDRVGSLDPRHVVVEHVDRTRGV